MSEPGIVYLTRGFWLETADRAIKTAAQGVLLGLGLGEGLNLFDVPWELALGFAGGGAFLSFLTSLISARAGSPGNASFMSVPGSTPPEAETEGEEPEQLFVPDRIIEERPERPLPPFNPDIERTWPPEDDGG